MPVVLAGDTGGTKTRLAFFRAEAGGLVALASATYSSREHASLEEIVERFASEHGLRPELAGFGVAGPVVDGVGRTTNLPWVVDAKELARRLGVGAVRVINDLEANAWGIPALAPDDFLTLQAGAPGVAGNRVVVAAGTGLGVAGLYWDGATHHPFATEGGHSELAPRSALEDELLLWLRRQFSHVSCERAVSGPGIFNLYRFLRDSGRGVEEPWLAAAIAGGDPPAVIGRAALAGESPLCGQAIDLFLSIYGATAGNAALTLMATGGVYLGGGIAPKLIAKVAEPTFLAAFREKGRLQPLLEAMPVHVIRNERAALLGAARFALAHAGP